VVRSGDCLLLDDGRLQLRVEKVDPGELLTTVIDGGPLGEHKGINVPGVEFPGDRIDGQGHRRFAVRREAGIDFVALSFVQSAAVLRQARDLLRTWNAPEIPLVAKLERPEAIARLEEILDASDAVMVARGDLGLELPLERVPRVQKEITRWARTLEVPVIVATQVLESMRTAPRPTRAEVSDAANAVEDGVDAIMLAGETAAGEYPVKAVQTLDVIIREAEAMPPCGTRSREKGSCPSRARRLRGAVTLAERGDAAAIVAVTRGGKTPGSSPRFARRAPIYAASDDAAILRCLSLVWGVVPTLTDLADEVNATATRIGSELVARARSRRVRSSWSSALPTICSHGPSNFVNCSASDHQPQPPTVKEFTHSLTIDAPPAVVLDAFFNHDALADVVEGDALAVRAASTRCYAVEWDAPSGVMMSWAGWVVRSKGRSSSSRPDGNSSLLTPTWLPPDGEPIGPMAFEATCSLVSGRTVLHIRQSGFEHSDRWMLVLRRDLDRTHGGPRGTQTTRRTAME
jgi:pyruvate kinase